MGVIRATIRSTAAKASTSRTLPARGSTSLDISPQCARADCMRCGGIVRGGRSCFSPLLGGAVAAGTSGLFSMRSLARTRPGFQGNAPTVATTPRNAPQCAWRGGVGGAVPVATPGLAIGVRTCGRHPLPLPQAPVCSPPRTTPRRTLCGKVWGDSRRPGGYYSAGSKRRLS